MTTTVVMRVMVVGRERRSMHVVMMLGHTLLGLHDRRFADFGMRGDAFHRDSRKRLNRQAQRQQHDDEEFAPI
ncbi:hypothetical protein BCO18430_03355 [Burkholderia contaminans]|uniref:hypothetical protein n=1 Tax=Burkholderia contaminans TaxID=488447 RepID=UPI00145387C1|nr:hypothetical protein [Burkholderia contaminans]VWC92691.1 hypothetical protein BCO18430_03355 [Burkholderia contaminans]